MNNPTIVVIAYDRSESLSRVLTSLKFADYPESPVRLVISIDSNDNTDVYQVADSYDWPYGEKIVIKNKKRLGLRKHVLQCGDLTDKYSNIIMLEDDLFVSPSFYHYTLQALKFYEHNEKVSGISLYNHKYNVNVGQNFEPLLDGSDVYWLQFASSWGQAWTEKQWAEFRSWYDLQTEDITSADNLPDSVISWPQTSWLKYFIKFLAVKNKYFIYPRESLTSNFSDVGTHVKREIYQFQVNLNLRKVNYKFTQFDDSLAIYDTFFELSPHILKSLHSELNSFDFESDLYGSKKVHKIESPYLLTVKKSSKCGIHQFSRQLWPHELNVIFSNSTQTQDGVIIFDKKENFNDDYKVNQEDLRYFKGDLTRKELSLYIKDKLLILQRRVKLWS